MDDTVTQVATEPTPAAPTPPEPTPTDPTLLSGAEPTPPAAEPEPKPSTVLTEPVSLVKPDGTFIEGWKDKLPEELRNEKVLDTVTDFNNAIKQLVHHKKMVGDKQVGEIKLFLQPPKEIDDLRLNGNIQR